VSLRSAILRRPTHSRRGRLTRVVVGGAVALLLSPILFLHAAAFVISLHDRTMKHFTSRTIADAAGHKVHFYQLKQPNPNREIVFIHGTPATAAVFGEQFRRPFPRANLVALDRPGFDQSTPATRKPSLEEQAQAIGASLPKPGGLPVILVGHSYGGPLALLAAIEFTNQVAGVVLIGASLDPSQERTYLIQRLGDWPVLSWLLPRSLRQCNRELLTLRGDLVRLERRLPSLAVPVVMVHGAKDRLVPVANVNFLKSELARAGKEDLLQDLLFPGYNHFIPWEHPEAVEQAIGMVTRRLSEHTNRE
jgi:pimeloyl-ACP methyl ester carboxylesterase